ncbi:MAG: mechanosensitive ion channel, partial [Lachnospiraceae bacterium]|nr:mechanosensitive ion channel [Lachnospiraceae bacterium]
MDIQQIGKEAGVIEKFLQELPEKAFHLGLRVVLAALAFLVGVQLIRLIRHVLRKALDRSRVDDSAVSFIDSFVKFGMYFILVLTIASGLGVDAASIIALLGSASVAIGLAVQGSLSNFAGGVLLLILKPFAPGDYIRDGAGNEGTVETIDVFYTHLITPDHKSIVLPNGTLANGTITNFTKCPTRRLDISVGISYKDDIKRAKEVLINLLVADSAVLKDEEVMVFVDTLGESSVILNLRCWTLQSDYWTAKWRLTEEAKYALDEAGISIPYPQI